MVSGSQALEKVWLFSVPLHPMLIFMETFDSGISDTLGMTYISTIHLQVCCVLMYNLTLCKNHLHHFV